MGVAEPVEPPENNRTVACFREDVGRFVAVYDDGDLYNQKGYYRLDENVRYGCVDAWNSIDWPDKEISSS